jgi:hypothetical protein
VTSRARTCLLILAALIGSAPLRAQSIINGRVIDPNNKPVPNVEVLLHAITESSGSQIDKDTSRVDGTFDLRVDSVNAKSIYFVAVTYNGQLFMGDMLRPPFPRGQQYIVQVGVNPVDFGSSGATPPPASERAFGPGDRATENRVAGTLVIMVAILVIASVVFVALRRRPPEHRRLLVELARIEAEIAERATPDTTLEKRRQELRERLLDSNSG